MAPVCINIHTNRSQWPHRADEWEIVTCEPNPFDLMLMLVSKNCSSLHLAPFAPSSVRELAHHRASHWSGWIAGDSSSERRPSEEDPLTHFGSPSNRIDNSGTAAHTSPRANKFTIQTWTKVLKRNVRNTLICFYPRFDRGLKARSFYSNTPKENKWLFLIFHLLPHSHCIRYHTFVLDK